MIRLALAYVQVCDRCQRAGSPADTPAGAVRRAVGENKWRRADASSKRLYCRPCQLLYVGTHAPGSGVVRV